MENKTTVQSDDVSYEIEIGKSPELHKKDLPDEVFEGEKYVSSPKEIFICSTHSKDNWQDHRDYIDNHDGTISCKFCPFGSRLAGYQRVYEGKIVDLRSL